MSPFIEYGVGDTNNSLALILCKANFKACQIESITNVMHICATTVVTETYCIQTHIKKKLEYGITAKNSP